MRRLVRWLAKRIEYAERKQLQQEIERRDEKIRQLCVERIETREDREDELRSKDTEIAKLQSDVAIRDNEIAQLTRIIKRNQERVKAETALLVRFEKQAMHGEQVVCPTCRRLT